MIAAAPLDPERTALLLIGSPPEEAAGPSVAAPVANAAALLAHARAAGAIVVHVPHLPAGRPPGDPAADVTLSGWETVLDTADPDPFADTRLGEELSARGVETVVLAGPMSLACCDAASSQALARRFRTVVADDATDARGEGAAGRARLLEARCRAGAEVLSAGSIVALLGAVAP